MATLHMQLDLPVPKGPLGPSNSTICPRTATKRPPKAPAFVHIGRRQPQTKNRLYLGLRCSKRDFRRSLQPPTFGGFHTSKWPSPTPRPPYLGPVGCGKLQEVAQRGGCQNWSTRSTRCKKRLFSKMILDHMECQNKCFWRVLSSWWCVLALLKSPNALKMGYFGTKFSSKMGQKCVFPKMILDHLGCFNK